MNDLLAVAELCERADGPSFDLDKAILKALGFTWRGMNYWSADNETMWNGTMTFTHSIDAAALLVPEGYAWRLDCWGSFTARVFMPEKKYHTWHSRTSAPLALCVAALRARAAANSSGDRK
jgi:hypothetical protein